MKRKAIAAIAAVSMTGIAFAGAVLVPNYLAGTEQSSTAAAPVEAGTAGDIVGSTVENACDIVDSLDSVGPVVDTAGTVVDNGVTLANEVAVDQIEGVTDIAEDTLDGVGDTLDTDEAIDGGVIIPE